MSVGFIKKKFVTMLGHMNVNAYGSQPRYELGVSKSFNLQPRTCGEIALCTIRMGFRVALDAAVMRRMVPFSYME